MLMYVWYSKKFSLRKSNPFTIVTIEYLTYNLLDIIIIIIIARAAIVSETRDRWENRPKQWSNNEQGTIKFDYCLIIVFLYILVVINYYFCRFVPPLEFPWRPHRTVSVCVRVYNSLETSRYSR